MNSNEAKRTYRSESDNLNEVCYFDGICDCHGYGKLLILRKNQHSLKKDYHSRIIELKLVFSLVQEYYDVV